jgi:DNA-binding transcriptional LysR family regulator
MDLFNGMKTFVSVVDAGSFAGAAERLSLSRTMVSKYVMELENHLGTRLLNRTTRRLSLTEAGAAYYERSVQILNDVEEAGQAATQLTARPTGTLKITAPVSFGILHLPHYLAEYGRRYPDVKMDISLNDRKVDLIEEGFDLAIRIGALAESGLIARRLAVHRGAVCAAPAYFERHGVPGAPADLVSHNCLNYTYAGDDWRFDGPTGSQVVKVSGTLRANNGDLLRVAALKGIGIIAQPLFIVGNDLKAGRLIEVLTDYSLGELGIYAVYPSRRHLSAKVRTFVDFLAAEMAPSDFQARRM